MKSTRGILAALIVSSTLSAGAAIAQPPPGVPARPLPAKADGDRRDARWDLKKLQDLQDRFAIARKRDDRRALKRIENELQQYVASELREFRSEVREGRTTRAEYRQESRERQRIRAIDRELERLYRRYDRSSMKRKSALISELVQLAKADLRDARDDARRRRA